MNTASITTVTIDFWQLIVAIAVVVVFIGSLMMVAGKMLLKQLDARFEDRDTAMQSLTEKVDEVEKDLLRMRGDLPNNYVQRDDWIRFSGVLDTKLDWLREKQEQTRLTVNTVAEQVNSMRSGNDGR